MKLSLNHLYTAYEKEFKRAVKDVAIKYQNLRARDSDYVYELNVYALEALEHLPEFMRKKGSCSRKLVVAFLKKHLNRRAIDLWRQHTKPCRICRKNKPKTPAIQPCGCIVGGPRWLSFSKDDPIFMNDSFEMDKTKLLLTHEEQDLLEKWSAPEFREKYPSHKSIMKDIPNLCSFYSLDPEEVLQTLTDLYEKLKNE